MINNLSNFLKIKLNRIFPKDVDEADLAIANFCYSHPRYVTLERPDEDWYEERHTEPTIFDKYGCEYIAHFGNSEFSFYLYHNKGMGGKTFYRCSVENSEGKRVYETKFHKSIKGALKSISKKYPRLIDACCKLEGD